MKGIDLFPKIQPREKEAIADIKSCDRYMRLKDTTNLASIATNKNLKLYYNITRKCLSSIASGILSKLEYEKQPCCQCKATLLTNNDIAKPQHVQAHAGRNTFHRHTSQNEAGEKESPTIQLETNCRESR
jgi:hypothetical protein